MRSILLIHLIIWYILPLIQTSLQLCIGKYPIGQSKLGNKFVINYCKAYGGLLNNGSKTDLTCKCVTSDEGCKYPSNIDEQLRCSANEICCLDDLHDLKYEKKDSKTSSSRVMPLNQTLDNIENEKNNHICLSADFASYNYPWYALLKSYSYRSKKLETKCAAVILHPTVILTDSFCYSGKEKLYISSEQQRGLELFRDKITYKFLALVRLKKALEFSETIRSACLPFVAIDKDKSKSCILLTETGPELTQNILDKDTCLTGLSNEDKLDGKHQHTICTSSENKNKCQIDSKTRMLGSPLFCELQGREGRQFAVAGIVSKMLRCDGVQPMEYFSETLSAPVLTWISETFADWGLDVSSCTN